jgi:L-alanine-DL-glutamate epimerase-like enolase superfamily enzyme
VPPTAERLRAALAALAVAVEDATCRVAEIALPDYPGGPRPTGVVTLNGAGAHGVGEHVGFTQREQQAFRDAVIPRVPRGRGRLDAFVAALHGCATSPYERAALEAAAIDLALAQARTNCARLLGVVPAPVRYVVSFGPLADPLPALAAAGGLDVKLDVDAAWSDATLAALAASGRVAVVDWKGRGDRTAHERVHAALPAAWCEDPAPAAGPWSPALHARLAADAPVATAADVDASPLPTAVNLKPARMGGVLEALEAAARCERQGRAVYFGGMWEVGPGRQQLRALASLVAPEGPNDIAPLTHPAGPRPPRLRVDPAAVGFVGGPAA